MKTSIQPMSGADLVAPCEGASVTDPQSGEEQSRSLPTPKCHSRYIIPACIFSFFIVALQLCSRRHPLAGFEVFVHGAMFKMSEGSTEGESERDMGTLS